MEVTIQQVPKFLIKISQQLYDLLDTKKITIEGIDIRCGNCVSGFENGSENTLYISQNCIKIATRFKIKNKGREDVFKSIIARINKEYKDYSIQHPDVMLSEMKIDSWNIKLDKELKNVLVNTKFREFLITQISGIDSRDGAFVTINTPGTHFQCNLRLSGAQLIIINPNPGDEHLIIEYLKNMVELYKQSADIIF